MLTVNTRPYYNYEQSSIDETTLKALYSENANYTLKKKQTKNKASKRDKCLSEVDEHANDLISV